MRRGATRGLAMAAALAVLVLSCSEAQDSEPPPLGGEDPSSAEQVPPEDDEGSVDEPEESDEPLHARVPEDAEDLGEEYAQAVLDHLMGVYNDGYRQAMRGAPVPAEAPPAVLAAAVHDTVEETWADGLLEADHESLTEPVWSELEEQFLPVDEWRGRRTEIDQVEVVDDGRCLLVEGDLDESQSLQDPPDEPRRVGHALIRSDDVPRGDNESAWLMAPLLFLEDAPPDAWGPERCR